MLDVGGVTSAALDVLHRVTAHLNISEASRPLNPNPYPYPSPSPQPRRQRSVGLKVEELRGRYSLLVDAAH